MVRDDVSHERLVRPGFRRQLSGDLVVGATAQDDGVDALKERSVFGVGVRRAAVSGEPVDAAIRIGDVAVQAHGDVEYD